MHLLLPPRGEPPGLVHEHAADLLLAARGLRSMAGADKTLPAVAATLGCVETAIDALSATVPGHEAAGALRVARDLTGGLRDRVGPALAEAAGRAAAGRPNPAHMLYDDACALLAAAQHLRALAPRDQAAARASVAATLDALAGATDAIGRQVAAALDTGPGEVAMRFSDLTGRLRIAAEACAA